MEVQVGEQVQAVAVAAGMAQTVEVVQEQPAIPVRTRDRVHIVGFAASKAETPWDDKEAELWGINELYMEYPDKPWTRWFELHGDRFTRQRPNERVEDHVGGLAKLTCPVYLWEMRADIPNSVAYPVEEIVNRYGRYFTNSISWEIALAIAMGFKEISVYGVDMAQSSEYCLAPETRVLTADLRWVPVSGIKVGDELCAFDEYPLEGTTYRQWRKAGVLEVQQLTRPCYRLTMADGTELVSSAEHRWLEDSAQYEWTATENLVAPIVTQEVYEALRSARERGNATYKELAERFGLSWAAAQRIGDGKFDVTKCKQNRIVKLVETWEEDRSWGSGFLAGAFDGEGWLSQKSRGTRNGAHVALGFSQRPNAMSETVLNELSKRGFKTTSHNQGPCIQWLLRGNKGVGRACRDEMLRFLGSMRPQRLLAKFDPNLIGCIQKKDGVPILKKEFLGEQAVIGLGTTTGTFIAEGFASHNSAQRPSCEYFIGLARGLGIKVYLPPTSDLLKATTLYGLEDENPLIVKLRARKIELTNRLNQHQQAVAQNQAAVHQLLGAIEDCKYIEGVWTNDMARSQASA